MRWWRGLRHRWGELTRLERVLFKALWPVGAALFIAGLAGDARGWWDNNPFLLELTGSMTGFLIGIPVAVAILQPIEERIQATVAERVRDAKTVRGAQAAAQQFLAALLDSFCRRALHEEVLIKLREGRSSRREPRSGPASTCSRCRCRGKSPRLVTS